MAVAPDPERLHQTHVIDDEHIWHAPSQKIVRRRGFVALATAGAEGQSRFETPATRIHHDIMGSNPPVPGSEPLTDEAKKYQATDPPSYHQIAQREGADIPPPPGTPRPDPGSSRVVYPPPRSQEPRLTGHQLYMAVANIVGQHDPVAASRLTQAWQAHHAEYVRTMSSPEAVMASHTHPERHRELAAWAANRRDRKFTRSVEEIAVKHGPMAIPELPANPTHQDLVDHIAHQQIRDLKTKAWERALRAASGSGAYPEHTVTEARDRLYAGQVPTDIAAIENIAQMGRSSIDMGAAPEVGAPGARHSNASSAVASSPSKGGPGEPSAAEILEGRTTKRTAPKAKAPSLVPGRKRRAPKARPKNGPVRVSIPPDPEVSRGPDDEVVLTRVAGPATKPVEMSNAAANRWAKGRKEYHEERLRRQEQSESSKKGNR